LGGGSFIILIAAIGIIASIAIPAYEDNKVKVGKKLGRYQNCHNDFKTCRKTSVFRIG